MTSDIPTRGRPRIYEQAQQSILEIIEQRNYIAGDRIPSERDLSERLGVHRMTVRKAIDRLVADGVLQRRGTSGTYIPTPVILRPVADGASSYSISEIVKRCGGRPGSRLLFFEQRDADHPTADRLGIRAGDPTIVIKRLRTVNDLPFCIETSHLPLAYVPGLAADDLASDASLFTLLEERYAIAMGGSNAVIGVTPTLPQDAELLGLKRGESALVIHVVASDTDDRPVEYMTSLNHPRRVMLTTDGLLDGHAGDGADGSS